MKIDFSHTNLYFELTAGKTEELTRWTLAKKKLDKPQSFGEKLKVVRDMIKRLISSPSDEVFIKRLMFFFQETRRVMDTPPVFAAMEFADASCSDQLLRSFLKNSPDSVFSQPGMRSHFQCFFDGIGMVMRGKLSNSLFFSVIMEHPELIDYAASMVQNPTEWINQSALYPHSIPIRTAWVGLSAAQKREQVLAAMAYCLDNTALRSSLGLEVYEFLKQQGLKKSSLEMFCLACKINHPDAYEVGDAKVLPVFRFFHRERAALFHKKMKKASPYSGIDDFIDRAHRRDFINMDSKSTWQIAVICDAQPSLVKAIEKATASSPEENIKNQSARVLLNCNTSMEAWALKHRSWEHIKALLNDMKACAASQGGTLNQSDLRGFHRIVKQLNYSESECARLVALGVPELPEIQWSNDEFSSNFVLACAKLQEERKLKAITKQALSGANLRQSSSASEQAEQDPAQSPAKRSPPQRRKV